jgi:hypothetical protein
MRVGVSGHRNIPAEAISYVRDGLVRAVSDQGSNLVGISCLAAGADQLFASVILEQGGHLHVIIPCRDYETTFSEKADLDSFFLLLDKADHVTNLEYLEPSEDAYLKAGHRVVDNSDLLIAVWDGEPARGKGGTGDIVKYARSRGTKVIVIWPDGVAR